MNICPVCQHPTREFDERCNQCSAPLTIAPAPMRCSCGLRMEQVRVVVIDGARIAVWQCPQDRAQSFRAAGVWETQGPGAA